MESVTARWNVACSGNAPSMSCAPRTSPGIVARSRTTAAEVTATELDRVVVTGANVACPAPGSIVLATSRHARPPKAVFGVAPGYEREGESEEHAGHARNAGCRRARGDGVARGGHRVQCVLPEGQGRRPKPPETAAGERGDDACTVRSSPTPGRHGAVPAVRQCPGRDPRKNCAFYPMLGKTGGAQCRYHPSRFGAFWNGSGAVTA